MARNQNYGSGNIKKKKKKKGIINSDKFDIYYGYSQHKLICFFFFVSVHFTQLIKTSDQDYNRKKNKIPI